MGDGACLVSTTGYYLFSIIRHTVTRQPVPAGGLTAGYQIAKKTTSAKTPPVSRLMAVKRITPQGTISATARFRQISKPGTEGDRQQQQALADHQPLYTLADGAHRHT